MDMGDLMSMGDLMIYINNIKKKWASYGRVKTLVFGAIRHIGYPIYWLEGTK